MVKPMRMERMGVLLSYSVRGTEGCDSTGLDDKRRRVDEAIGARGHTHGGRLKSHGQMALAGFVAVRRHVAGAPSAHRPSRP